jgi:acyl carrier protein
MQPTTRQKIDTRSGIVSRVKRTLIQRLSLAYAPDDLHEDVSLLGSGLGLDSLDALEVILGIEQEFGVKVAEGNVSVLRSINTIVDHLLEKGVVAQGAR